METTMHAVRVHQFGGPDALVWDKVPRPRPGRGEVLMQVKAAGVAAWDAWIAAGRSVLPHLLPLTPGSDVAGVVVDTGAAVSHLRNGDEVFGLTNGQFTGGYAEYAVASAAMLTRKPARLSFVDAASVPAVACMAWQMVFDRAQTDHTKRVLVHGGAGSVGSYAVQLAKRVAGEVIATAFGDDIEYVRSLGADRVIDGGAGARPFDEVVTGVDVVLDTVGGETQDRSFSVLKPGGVLVSAVSEPDQERAAAHSVRAVYFTVEVSSSYLDQIVRLFEAGELTTNVGEVLPLADFRTAHEMLAGRSHKHGKIVLTA